MVVGYHHFRKPLNNDGFQVRNLLFHYSRVLFSGEAEKNTFGGIMPLAKSNDKHSMD